MLVQLAQRFARMSPAIHRIGGGAALRGLETYAAFFAGKGSGSGWDLQNQTKAAASLIARKPAVIFDVGANDGRWSVELESVLQNAENQYFLFEPAEYCFPGLDKRRKVLPNAKVFKVAVSDKDGQGTLYQPPVGSGLASLHERRDISVVQHKYKKLEVETRSLDSIVRQCSVESIDFLKMDVEGHELSVLQGANDLLSRRAIKVVMFEFGSANVNSRTFFRDFWDLLSAHGFRVSRILPGGGKTTIERYAEDLEYFRGATNYAACLN